MTLACDGLIGCITRWLPVLDEAELRAVEGFVLELVIESRERAMLSACAQAETPAVPHGAARADAYFEGRAPTGSGNAGQVKEPSRDGATVPALSVPYGTPPDARDNPFDSDATWERRRFDVSDTGGES